MYSPFLICFLCDCTAEKAVWTKRMGKMIRTLFLKGFALTINLMIMSRWVLYKVSIQDVKMMRPISGSMYFSMWRESRGLCRIRKLCEDENPSSYGKAGRWTVRGEWQGSNLVVGQIVGCIENVTWKTRSWGNYESLCPRSTEEKERNFTTSRIAFARIHSEFRIISIWTYSYKLVEQWNIIFFPFLCT